MNTGQAERVPFWVFFDESVEQKTFLKVLQLPKPPTEIVNIPFQLLCSLNLPKLTTQDHNVGHIHSYGWWPAQHRAGCSLCKSLDHFICRLCHSVFLAQEDLMILQFKGPVGDTAKTGSRCGLQSLWITKVFSLKRNWSCPVVPFQNNLWSSYMGEWKTEAHIQVRQLKSWGSSKLQECPRGWC